MDRRSFGRRGASQPLRTQVPAKSAAQVQQPAPAVFGADLDLSRRPDSASLDEELHAWKQQRSFVVPWKQLCLMATLCFGLASFVLPSGVNSAVNWLLYGLTGMSFYAWFVARRARTKP